MGKIISFIITTMLISTTVAQEQPFTTTDGVNLYVKVKGNGQPCVLVHGGPGSGSYWMEKFAGDILESRFQMIYVDLRGVSRSSSPLDSNYSLNRIILDFEEIRTHLNIDHWIVMGHSFSGTILTGYGNKYPKSIKGMMMFNCTLNLEESLNESWIPYACQLLGLNDISPCTDQALTTHQKLNKLFTQLNQNELSWKMTFAELENEALMNATFREIPNWNSDFSGIGISHPDYVINFKPLTSQINVPVLFFYGKSDWTIGPNHFEGVHFPKMLIWGSEVGHVPFMENKADVAKSIDAFLKKFRL